MSIKSIECTVYMTKQACDCLGSEYGVGYPAILTGSDTINVTLPKRGLITAYCGSIEYICDTSVVISDSTEFTARTSIDVPTAGSIESGGVIKAHPHGDIVIHKWAGRLRLIPMVFLNKVDVHHLDLYTHIHNATGVDRNSVKIFLFKTLLSNPKENVSIFDVVRELKLSYQEVSHIMHSFNEWTGAYK